MPGREGSGGDVIRDAATVMLLRDGGSGLQTWMLTRTSWMTFGAGAAVFPGGAVDPADAQLPFTDGAGARLAARFGVGQTAALALAGGAIREMYEETGVLFTTPYVDLADARADVEAGRVRFGDLLTTHSLTLDDAALYPWSRWVCPSSGSRRYDTRFFVAVLPEGQQPADVTFESSSADWVDVAQTVELACSGTLVVLLPTLLTLQQINRYGSVPAVLDAVRTRRLDEVTMPRYTVRDDVIEAWLPDGTYLERRKAPR